MLFTNLSFANYSIVVERNNKVGIHTYIATKTDILLSEEVFVTIVAMGLSLFIQIRYSCGFGSWVHALWGGFVVLARLYGRQGHNQHYS